LTKIAIAGPDLPEPKKRAIADEMVAKLMGGASQAGALQVGDAEGSFEEDDCHPQTFVAIDRFTGGAANGRLYTVEAVMPPCYEVDVGLDITCLGEIWRRGILIYLLRDAMEGDLQVGWGKARGNRSLPPSQRGAGQRPRRVAG